jgi:hypothetical protein
VIFAAPCELENCTDDGVAVIEKRWFVGLYVKAAELLLR